MGLSNYPCAAEGVIPLIVMNTVMSVALLKNIFRSVLQAIGATSSTTTTTSTSAYYYPYSNVPDTIMGSNSSYRRNNSVSITQYKSLCHKNKESGSASVMAVECCVCLCGFKANQEVSELPCKHFFHTRCLDKWFHNRVHTTCPLCRSYY